MINVRIGKDDLKGYLQIQLKNGKKVSINNGRTRIGNKSYYFTVNVKEVGYVREQAKKYQENNLDKIKERSREYERNHREERNQQARKRLEELKKHPRKYAEYCKKQQERNRKQRLKKKQEMSTK